VRGEAALGLARLTDDKIAAALLSGAVDGHRPAIDLDQPVDRARVEHAASELDLKPDRVHDLYEEVASRYPLRLDWLP
jgi:hypothetical protein